MHRCGSRQIFEGAKEFFSKFPKLGRKIFVRQHSPYKAFSQQNMKTKTRSSCFQRCMTVKKTVLAGLFGIHWKKEPWISPTQNKVVLPKKKRSSTDLVGAIFWSKKSNPNIFHHSVSFEGVETSMSEFSKILPRFWTNQTFVGAFSPPALPAPTPLFPCRPTMIIIYTKTWLQWCKSNFLFHSN